MTQAQANVAPRIRLYVTVQGWMAQFLDDAEVMRLFGTDTLPTPFTAQADAGMVLTATMKRNPGACVDVAAGPVVR
jgi:hypothetical protein